MNRIKDYKSLIVPLFFVPIGNLTGDRGFTVDDMKDYHWRLVLKCWNHGMRWAEVLAKEYVDRMPWLPRFYLLRFMEKVVKKFSKQAEKEIIRLMEQSRKAQI